ncbi:MAG TPA: translation elongation factor 4 [Anaerohalosphaeraceae bacterium]|nr:translation elongation factor 4 [Phycisphaerae bacterium]HOM75015.1 translation elongation factor 4 [Anaerohalosphaeraceae bacterium]HPC63647.1 translation elongation factor 4 [Anaerohalosphaeraceae bacterium]HPO68903.1 translation elongation factor 4 [Anaerohalosphaeraceae bacterium]HRS72475.1 translation elongation factor 4 [Anaerohalosphaeraceae bacterium]
MQNNPIPIQQIRNFSIVAHIDHGKSTLADRLLERTGAISEREMKEQLLDDMDLERERGITIKASAVTMQYTYQGTVYMLNLIDTPGHVDFHYEVSRALTACEGALLVVDASQGVEAQTVANAYLAVESGCEIVGVINKIDLPAAQPDRVAEEVEHVLGLNRSECIFISAKTGQNIDALLEAVVKRLPPPQDKSDCPTAALIFDSHADEYRGVICYVRVFEGSLKTRQRIRLMGSGRSYTIVELGKFTPRMTPVEQLGCGEVGYVIANIKNLSDVTIGDTITDAAEPAAQPLPGYKPPMQMVFSDFYPGGSTDYPRLRAAFEKLALNDASFSFVPQNSPALGFGFRCGFLGLLHMEIVQERLERESDIDVVQTAPTVSYEILMTNGQLKRIDSPSELPDRQKIAEIREPMVKLEIITTRESIGGIMKLAEERRCVLLKTEYISPTRVMMEYKAPLAEIVYDFYDVLKGISRGYATMDYEFLGFEAGNLVRIDILVNGTPVDALSLIVHRTKAEQRGRKLILKLKKAIPRHQFEIPLQVAIGGKIIARETIKAFRKDVTAKLYGGDVTRKMKLLKKQKEGKKRMKSIGMVNIPQEAFMSILDTSEE